MPRYDHIDFAPPAGAREAAKRALDVRAEKPESERGMTPVGIARARDLANGRRLSPDTARRMLAYFQRHEGDKSGETWASQGKGWQAWNGWGGDAGYAWARKVVRQLDAADKAATMSEGPHTSACVVLTVPDELASYIALDNLSVPGDAHVTLAHLGDAAALGAEGLDRVRAIVSEWARSVPPMPARLSGDALFAGDDADALVLLVDAPGLSAARDDLARRLRAAGLPVSADHGFTPHVTLAYVPKDSGRPSISFDLPIAFVLDAASVWAADVHGEPIALSGTGDPSLMSDTNSIVGEPLSADAPAASDDFDGVTLRGEPIAIAFADGGAASVGHSTWNQIARVGPMKGHPQGAAEFTKENLAQIVANFAALRNGEVPGDFEHFSERPPPDAARVGVPAPFWVKKVELRNGGAELWGLFKWVDPNAVKMVRAEQYKYVSPAVNFNARSRESGLPIGARLTSVALTNHPFIDGLAPLTADSRESAIMTIARAIGLDAETVRKHLDALRTATAAPHAMSPSPDSIHAPTTGAPTSTTEKHMDEETEMKGALSPSSPKGATPGAAAMAEPPAATIEGAKPSADKDFAGKYRNLSSRMASMCGMADFAPDAEGAEDALIAAIQAKLDMLKASQEREKATMQTEAAAMADRVIASKRAPAAAKDTLTALYMSDRKAFDALYPSDATVAAPRSATVAPAVPSVMTRQFAGREDFHATAGEGVKTFSQRVEARAAAIAAERKVDLITATTLADRELRAAG